MLDVHPGITLIDETYLLRVGKARLFLPAGEKKLVGVLK